MLEIDFANCKTSENCLGIITHAIKDNIYITLLDLSYMKLDLRSVTNLCSFISGSPNLRNLNISNTQIRESDMHLLLNAMRINESLAFVNLSKNSMKTPNFQSVLLLAELIRVHPNLKHLDVSSTSLEVK